MNNVLLFDHLFILYFQIGFEAAEMKGPDTAETKSCILKASLSSTWLFLAGL